MLNHKFKRVVASSFVNVRFFLEPSYVPPMFHFIIFIFRVCVQASLDPSEHFRLDANLSRSDKVRREALHVQSVSYWAPANIGPYSQAVKVGR